MSEKRRLSDEERQQRRAQDRERARPLRSSCSTARAGSGGRGFARRAACALSLNNQLLVALARPDATFVADFKAWLKLGYCVRKARRRSGSRRCGSRTWPPTATTRPRGLARRCTGRSCRARRRPPQAGRQPGTGPAAALELVARRVPFDPSESKSRTGASYGTPFGKPGPDAWSSSAVATNTKRWISRE